MFLFDVNPLKLCAATNDKFEARVEDYGKGWALVSKI